MIMVWIDEFVVGLWFDDVQEVIKQMKMEEIREWEVQGKFGKEKQEEWNENDDEQ